MTIQDIKKRYPDYTIEVLDGDGFYWCELPLHGGWYAVGEWGWNTTEEKINNAEIKNIKQYDQEKTIMVYVNKGL